MARTQLFSIARKALMAAGAPMGPSALTRRQALLLGGSAALAACAPTTATNWGERGDGGQSIGIVGGGVAGLTIAYRLSKAGRRATLYEASGRFGGRMFTKRNFNSEGMFCELGGELVDTNHEPLIKLAGEVGVGIQRLRPEAPTSFEIYSVDKRLRSERDMLLNGKGAFVPIARRIAKDKESLTGPDESWTEHARKLDQISIAEYLHQFRGKAAPWVIDLIALAYRGEYGLPIDRQSALNLIDFIGADTKAPFSMYGESDEAHRIEGGSSSLPDALFARLDDGIARKPQHALSRIAVDGKRKIVLSFTTDRGRVDAAHDVVVLALPFTKLREVEGLASLGLESAKLRSIRELGYGDNAKVMVGTTGRPWNEESARFPAPSNGTFYSKDFQLAWETSRGQEGARGIFTNFLQGARDQESALANLERGLRKISPKVAESLDPENVASFFWTKYPFMRGSYASALVGQYTTLLEVAGTPELDGRLQFAGEHTSADFPGFMCGGVQSGERVAAALLGAKAASLHAA